MRPRPAHRPPPAFAPLALAAALACSDAPPTAPAAHRPSLAATRSARTVASPTDLGVLGGIAGDCCFGARATDINNLGQVVGISQTEGDEAHGFLWESGTGMRDLGRFSPVAINDRGQVLGRIFPDPPGSPPHAALREPDGSMVDLGPFEPADLNAAGQAVGWTTDPGAVPHAVLWTPGRGLTNLGSLRGIGSQPWAINDAGQVVGDDVTAIVGDNDLQFRALLWEPSGELVDLGTLGGPLSVARGINGRGQVVGFSATAPPGSEAHSFLWEAGRGVLDLAPLGVPLGAWDINDAGQVAGSSGSPLLVAFLWTPGEGTTELGLLPGDIRVHVEAVNAAGQVVGTSSHDGEFGFSVNHAVLWTVRPAAGGAPRVDRLLAVVLPPGNPTGLTGVWLRVRLTDASDADRWDWRIDWGDRVDTPTGVERRGEFAFLRRQPYSQSGTFTIAVTATNQSGVTSPTATTTVTVP
jgi:probable HAF family extracellular repeat protein